MAQSEIESSYATLLAGFREVALAYYREGRSRSASRVLRAGVDLIEQSASGDVDEHDQARLLCE